MKVRAPIGIVTLYRLSVGTGCVMLAIPKLDTVKPTSSPAFEFSFRHSDSDGLVLLWMPVQYLPRHTLIASAKLVGGITTVIWEINVEA